MDSRPAHLSDSARGLRRRQSYIIAPLRRLGKLRPSGVAKRAGLCGRTARPGPSACVRMPPTVNFAEPRVLHCLMATMGGRPVRERINIWYQAWAAAPQTGGNRLRRTSAKRISYDIEMPRQGRFIVCTPEPETPVITVSEPGISTETSFRLCLRAPRREMEVGHGLHAMADAEAKASSPCARKRSGP